MTIQIMEMNAEVSKKKKQIVTAYKTKDLKLMEKTQRKGI
jgi:hypothetical protein